MVTAKTIFKRTQYNCGFFLHPESKHLVAEGKLMVGQEYDIKIIKKRKK